MAQSQDGKVCGECGNKHSVQRGPCDPLEKRQGPKVTDANHPSNNGSWDRTINAVTTTNTDKTFGPYK